MKTVYIIHGWEGRPDEPMLSWLRENLEREGFKVVVPSMPDSEAPEIKKWVGKIAEIVPSPDEDTFFIGHSVGCQAVLRYLEKLSSEVRVGGVVLIAPWMELDKNTIEEEGEEVVEIARPWMETPIDFEKVRQHTDNFTAIFSDNDIYVPLEGKDVFEKELGAEIIIEHKMGHFAPSDGIKEVPSVLKAVLEQGA